jgi:predicted aspartyl protease
VAYISGTAFTPRLVQLNKNKSLLKAFAIAAIVFVVFALGLWMEWHKSQLGARLRRMHTVLTRTIASPSLAPPASMVAAPSLSHWAVDQLWRGVGSFECSASISLGGVDLKSVEAPNTTSSELPVKLREQVKAQVPAPTEPTSPSPAPAATVSEAKPTPQGTAADKSALDSLLKQEGFGVVKLKQQNLDNQKAYKNDSKHLIIDVEVNRVSALLMVDTGTPTTNIARGSLKKFGLVEQKTPYRVTSPLGSASNKFYGITKLNTLAMGNCVIQDVPVAIEAIPYVDGVFGSDDMHRIGAVLDCGEPALYYAPRGPRSDTSTKLAAMLQSNGFTQIPMRLTSGHRLEVACSINGVPSTIIVDTGSIATCVDKTIGIKAGIIMKRARTVLIGSGGARAPVSIGRVKQFAIGDFEIRDAAISFVHLRKADHPSAYLLGIGELVANSAIIDVGGLSMYLRHPQ